MRAITVYRVDYARRTRSPIGWVMERRKAVRNDNYLGLLRLARKEYALSPEDAFYITIDGKEARRTWVRTAPGEKRERLRAGSFHH